MRAILAVVLAAAAVSGCRTRNPYDTGALEVELAVRDERALALEQALVWVVVEPPVETLPELHPNLDLWYASDVEKADAATLLAMEEVAAARVARLGAQLTELQAQPVYVVHHEVLKTRNDFVVERKKHAIILSEIHKRVGG